jgi:hypothetical protein
VAFALTIYLKVKKYTGGENISWNPQWIE